MESSRFSGPPDEGRGEPLVLLLGNVDHEGITSHLKSGGEQYKKKLLESKPENWSAILGHFYTYRVRAVIAKLNANVYELLASPGYKEVGHDLFDKIATTRHAVFVYEDLLSRRTGNRIQAPPEEEGSDFVTDGEEADYGGKFGLYQPRTQILDIVNKMLRDHGLNLIPYRTNAELTVVASELLKEALEGFLFRFYVPTGRLWASEIDRLLQLFRDYLVRTGRKGIRLSEVRTDYGISYEFHGDDSSPAPSLAMEFKDFSRLLDLCVSNPIEAEAMLKQKTVDPKEIIGILTRYSKEAKRLQIDLRHDRERKLLAILQRLESELTDSFQGETDWNLIETLVANAMPEAYSFSSLLPADHRYMQILPVINGRELTLNIHPQIIQTVNGVVAQEIRGNINTSRESEELRQLIDKYGIEDAAELNAAFQVLSDPGISKPDRLTSAQKLKAFVFHVAEKIEPIAANLLTSYIERKMALK